MVILALGFVIYFFVYVKGQEESLNTRGFRILSKLGDNIAILGDTRIKNVKNNLRSRFIAKYDAIKWKQNGKKYNIELNIDGITDPIIDSLFDNISVFDRVLSSGQNFVKVQDTVTIGNKNINKILKYQLFVNEMLK